MDSFGQFFKVTIFGESHGPAIGVTIDGVPENIPLYEEDFEDDIARRAPGRKGTTARKESDRAKILSGTYNGYTTGAPLTIIFWNSNIESQDYLKFAEKRGGHTHHELSAAFAMHDTFLRKGDMRLTDFAEYIK